MITPLGLCNAPPGDRLKNVDRDEGVISCLARDMVFGVASKAFQILGFQILALTPPSNFRQRLQVPKIEGDPGYRKLTTTLLRSIGRKNAKSGSTKRAFGQLLFNF